MQLGHGRAPEGGMKVTVLSSSARGALNVTVTVPPDAGMLDGEIVRSSIGGAAQPATRIRKRARFMSFGQFDPESIPGGGEACVPLNLEGPGLVMAAAPVPPENPAVREGGEVEAGANLGHRGDSRSVDSRDLEERCCSSNPCRVRAHPVLNLSDGPCAYHDGGHTQRRERGKRAAPEDGKHSVAILVGRPELRRICRPRVPQPRQASTPTDAGTPLCRFRSGNTPLGTQGPEISLVSGPSFVSRCRSSMPCTGTCIQPPRLNPTTERRRTVPRHDFRRVGMS